MVIVNMSPSVVRAGISTIIAMFATLIYRKQDTYTTISIALLLTLLNIHLRFLMLDYSCHILQL